MLKFKDKKIITINVQKVYIWSYDYKWYLFLLFKLCKMQSIEDIYTNLFIYLCIYFICVITDILHIWNV